MKIINIEKKKMIPLTNEKQESHKKTTISYNCKKILKINTLMIKNINQLGITGIIQVNTEVLHI